MNTTPFLFPNSHFSSPPYSLRFALQICGNTDIVPEQHHLLLLHHTDIIVKLYSQWVARQEDAGRRDAKGVQTLARKYQAPPRLKTRTAQALLGTTTGQSPFTKKMICFSWKTNAPAISHGPFVDSSGA
jgi:hypothetical protein